MSGSIRYHQGLRDRVDFKYSHVSDSCSTLTSGWSCCSPRRTAGLSVRRGSWCAGRGELPGLASHTPAPPQLTPRGLPTPPAPTGSGAVYHYPEGGRWTQLKTRVTVCLKYYVLAFFLRYKHEDTLLICWYHTKYTKYMSK